MSEQKTVLITGAPAGLDRAAPCYPVTQSNKEDSAMLKSKITAQDWFALGKRVSYDRRAKRILKSRDTTDSPDVVHVFQRVVRDSGRDKGAVWTTFLPGFPDGSFGWARVEQHLTGHGLGPKLFVEYVGQGDSDKPADYPYGTMERADLVESCGQQRELSPPSSLRLISRP